MAVYFFIYSIAIWNWFVLNRVREKKWHIFFCFFLLFVISTLRSSQMGADYENYINSLKYGASYYGLGYRLLNRIALWLGDSYVYLALTVNITIFSIVMYTYIKKIDKDYLVYAVALWTCNPYAYIQSSFNILRQGCAMAIVLLAASLISGKPNKIFSKKSCAFVAGILVAGTFHKSAYLFLLLLPFGLIKWKREYHIGLALLCMVLNLLFSNSGFMIPLAEAVGYGGYIDRNSSAKFDMPIFTFFIIFIIFYFFNKYYKLFSDKEEKWYVDLYLLSLNLLLLLVKNDIAYRLYIYFFFITIISVSIIIKNLQLSTVKRRELFILKNGYFLYYSAMYWLFIGLQVWDKNIKYYPFRFFWQA